MARHIFNKEECTQPPTKRDPQRMKWLKNVVEMEFNPNHLDDRINKMIREEIWKSCMSYLYADATNLRNSERKKKKIIEDDENDDMA